MQRYFHISVHALIVTAFFALALTGRLDAAAIILFTIGIGGSLYRTIYYLRPPLTARGAFVLSCIYIVVFLLDTAIVSRSFIPATIHLVLFLEVVKLYQEKGDRDYFYLIILSFLKILAAASLTVDMSFVITLVLFLIALVSTLMSFDMYRSERKASSGAPDVTVPLGTMSVWATIWILFLGALLFFLIPRVGTGYFSRATTTSLLLSGFSENVELGQIGQVKLNSAVVMRAKLVSGSPSAVVRWRGISLDAFNGRSWYKTKRGRAMLPEGTISPDGKTVSLSQYTVRPVDNSGVKVEYQVMLEPLTTTSLFGPHRVRSIQGSFPGLEIDSDDAIYSRFPTFRRIQYEVISEIPVRQRTIKPGSTDVDQIPSDIQVRYLQLPAQLDPGVARLAQQITASSATILEKATAVEAYLKANYKYTLELTWAPGPSPISTFLLSAKSGHCEYFASSMAILLRTVGIPTRIVNGFLMGEYNPIGDDYIVRQSDAHSWVEVYIPGREWIEFDPTPPDPRERASGLMAHLSRYMDAADLYWNSYVLVYDSGLQLQLFRSAQDSAQSLQTTLKSKSDDWLTRSEIFSDELAGRMERMFDSAIFWLVITLAVMIATAFRYRKRIRTQLLIWRLRKGTGSVNDDVVEEMFYRAARQVERESSRRRPGETWREWLRNLPDSDRRSLLAGALQIFEKSKYGRMPVSAADFTLLENTIRRMKA